VERRQPDTNVPGCFDEIQHVIAGGVGMGDQKMRDRPGIPRQEFSVGSAGKSVLNFTDDLPRGEIVLARGGRAGDAHQSRHLSQLQAQLGAQEKMSGDTTTGIISTGLLKKAERRPQDSKSLSRPLCAGNLRLVQPLFESFAVGGIHDHGQHLRDCGDSGRVAEV
jgi:hypothetical protein